MALIPIGIKNENNFYSSYYMDSLLEDDIKNVLADWHKIAEDNNSKTPYEELLNLNRDYLRLCSDIESEKNNFEKLKLQRGFFEKFFKHLGYNISPSCQEIEDKIYLPLLTNVNKSSGMPLLWVIELVNASADNIDSLDLNFINEQFDNNLIIGKDYLTRPIEEIIGKNVFTLAESPRYVIICTHKQILLIDQTKWNNSRLIRFDLNEIFNRKDTNTFKLMAILLHKSSIYGDSSLSLLDTLDEKSHKHAFGVSQDLKFALRESIELLGNEAVYYMKEILKEKIYERDLQAQLTAECLRFMYRLLFILYSEARPEIGFECIKDQSYLKGYSFEALRDLETVKLTSVESKNGYFISDSIRLLFEFIYRGCPETTTIEAINYANLQNKTSSFCIKALKSHLFDPEKTTLLNKVRFRNSVMLRIIKLVSLNLPSQKKQKRGRISYAHLGINQLGAVYESLLSFSGFFAETDLYEVQPLSEKNKKQADDNDDTNDDALENDEDTEESIADESFDESVDEEPDNIVVKAIDDNNFKGKKNNKNNHNHNDNKKLLEIAYFVPLEDLENYKQEERVFNVDGSPKKYSKGTFIYRQSGRDRETSASYYTPEVLTKCLVKYALKVLLENKSADDILKLKICEPAMGSGAFLNEAINQLAEAYLVLKQKETGKTIPHEKFVQEKQKVKMYIADRNVFGVDLNPTAVELAEVSLWLNSIYDAAPIPWFKLQLICGNSLIGARAQVYDSNLLAKENLNPWYETVPIKLSLSDKRPDNSIYHFLLGDPGMANYDTDKVIKQLAKAKLAQINKWQQDFNKSFDEKDIISLSKISNNIDLLWQTHINQLRSIRLKTINLIQIFGKGNQSQDNLKSTKEKDSLLSTEILSQNLKNSSPYRRLKLAMDYWCALWFWPIEKPELLPTRDEYLMEIQFILQETNASIDVDELALKFPRLELVAQLAKQYHFMHWELEFADIFKDNGGFDLILGNPPWIKTEWAESGILGDANPLLAIRKLSASNLTKLRKETLAKFNLEPGYLTAYEGVKATQNYLNAVQNYNELKGMQTNLYKCFLPKTWSIANNTGVIGLLHPDGVYDDSKGGNLREIIYNKLQYHFQFQNALILFPIKDGVKFSINIYANNNKEINFLAIANLFKPITIDLCFNHNGIGITPGIKDNNKKWNFIGHNKRIININPNTLAIFAKIYDDVNTTWNKARLPILHSSEFISILEKLSKQEKYLSNLQEENKIISSVFWDETNAQKAGIITRSTKFVESPVDLILSGPHFHIANPIWKTPRRICNEKAHYDEIDLNNINAIYIPRTNYIRACSKQAYDKQIPVAWNGTKITDYYKLVSRKMLSQPMERTLISAIAIPETAHINGVISLTFNDYNHLIKTAAFCFSIIGDFFIKSTGKSNLYIELACKFPLLATSNLMQKAKHRVLLLNCLTSYYSKLWNELWTDDFNNDSWSKLDLNLSDNKFKTTTNTWQSNYPLKTDYERRQALLEIDVLVAMALDLTLDELFAIYRIQFPVMQKYHNETYYDSKGRIVFTANKGIVGIGLNRKKWKEVKNLKVGFVEKNVTDDTLPDGPKERTIQYYAPFVRPDIIEDYKTAWDKFSKEVSIINENTATVNNADLVIN